jgi:hypothetical protein
VSQDPFEEFEFRPITEGLGFHRRKEAVKELEPSHPQVTKTSGSTLHVTNTKDSNPPTIEMPITNSTVDSVLESLKAKRKPLTFEEPKLKEQIKPSPKVTPTKSWEDSLPDISAIILDGMLVLAGVLASLIVTILTTQADLIAWSKYMGPLELSLSLYGLFAAVTFIYTTVCRSFLGFTAGEWVTDQVITTRSPGGFRFLSAVMTRALLNIATFYVTLPLLSNALGQDLAGQLSGARLSKEKL